jgi:hypothetical protein
MKFDSKQMHIASQLFMAASKAGHPFDLSRFVKESSYASETMAQLSVHADTQSNAALQELMATAMDFLSAMILPASLPSINKSPTAIPELSQKYVGQLR